MCNFIPFSKIQTYWEYQKENHCILLSWNWQLYPFLTELRICRGNSTQHREGKTPEQQKVESQKNPKT